MAANIKDGFPTLSKRKAKATMEHARRSLPGLEEWDFEINQPYCAIRIGAISTEEFDGCGVSEMMDEAIFSQMGIAETRDHDDPNYDPNGKKYLFTHRGKEFILFGDNAYSGEMGDEGFYHRLLLTWGYEVKKTSGLVRSARD